MTGRFSGYRGGRGGRSGGRGGRKPPVPKQEAKKKKSVEDYFFYVGSSKQASDFETTSEFLVNHIKKTFDRGNDIAEALRTLKPTDTNVWKPALLFSTETDPIVKAQENRQYEMEYKADLDEYMRRRRAYDENLFKAYALIWERCNKAMQNKVMAISNFEKKIYNDPIELLNSVKKHALNYQETRYEMSIISDSFRALFNVQQKENESLQDYTRRFKTAREILESHLGGPLILTKFVKTMKDYDVLDTIKTEECIVTASEQLFAFVYLENTDQAKYGSLLKGLNSQKSLGHDQYPKLVSESNNVLSNHKFDVTVSNKNKHQDRDRHKPKIKQEEKEDDASPILSFAQIEGKCYCCGKPGHRSPDCHKKDKIPKEEWVINKAQSHMTVSDDRSSSGSTLTSSVAASAERKPEVQVGWAGVHCSFAQLTNLKDLILLDSDSTDTVFCNPEYVTNIVNTDKALEIMTNGGPMVSQQRCQVPHLGEHWFNKDSITNIMALCDVTEKFRVTMDSSKEKALLVHMPHKVLRFKQMKGGLYAMNPKDPTNNGSIPGQSHLGQTLEENMAFLSPRQQKRAYRARQLYDAMGTPTVDDLKAMIRMNLIRNNIVTTEDVNLATKAFGAEIGNIKGKTTRSRPKPVMSNIIEIPDELLEVQRDVTLSMDGMMVNSLKFLTTISHEIFYRTAQYVSSAVASVYDQRLEEIIRLYKHGQFQVTEIHCDNEFHKVMDPFSARQDPTITVNYAAAQEHVPRAERNNRTIQERVRATYHRLPYDHLPRILVKYLVMESTKKLNFFPNKNGVSKYFSPRMILHQENLDYERHCTYSLGEYVLAHDEPQPSNTNAPRALDCIYLRPLDSAQGGHELLHLQTNDVVKRRKLTKAVVTPSVIKMVHKLAELDGMPKGLKIANRANHILFDSAWIAGVDYDEELFDDEDFDNDDMDEENENEDEDASYDMVEEYDEMDENEVADLMEEAHGFNVPNEANQHNEAVDEAIVFENEEEEIVFENEPIDSDEDHEDIEPIDSDEDYEDSEDEDVSLVADDEEEDDTNPNLRRINRVRTPNPRYGYQNLQANTEQIEEYTHEMGMIIAYTMSHYNNTMSGMNDVEAYSFLQTYSLNKGLKKFGELGRQAAHKEMKQLHDRVVFKPILIKDMTVLEKKRAMESLIFLAEKRDQTIKARTCANGSSQRAYVAREEATSPTAATDAILITGVIDAKQRRDVMTLDVPNAFVQTPIPQSGEKIIMKIRGSLVDILLEICPGVYDDFVVYEGKGKQKVVYVQMLMALYGMMIASILYYKKFRKDIESIGFEVNPYDICVANRQVNGKQHTVTWHVDDLKSSHEDSRVNDDFEAWCEKMYGSDQVGHVKVVRGKEHDYLAMILNFTDSGAMKVDMRYYIDGMLEDFPFPVQSTAKTPWTEKLFKVDSASKHLDDERRSIFHTFTMKAMFLSKRARPDINPAIGFFAGRVKQPNEGDWKKLLKVMGYLKGTREDVLTLEADDCQTLTWYVDAAFGVHADMKSQTGSVFTMGKGSIISDALKQKVNSRSSTEAELIGVDDQVSKILWTKRFLEWQDFQVRLNIVCQDNTSTMKLAKNGKASSGKRTRHFDIKWFYVTDLINRDEVDVRYCPTDDMLGDYMTKPLVGAKFHKFRDLIMNLSGKHHRDGQQECVGEQDNMDLVQ
jgi:hypothetical protein